MLLVENWEVARTFGCIICLFSVSLSHYPHEKRLEMKIIINVCFVGELIFSPSAS